MSKNLKLIFGLVILLTFSLVVVGCGDKTVATVNGEKITQKQLDESIELLSKQYQINLNDPQYASMAGALKQQTLDQMVQKELLIQEGEKRKIKITDADVDVRLEQIIKEYFQGDKKQFEQYLKDNTITDKYIREEVKLELIEKQITDALMKDAKIDAAAVKKYYEDNKASFGKQVEASHILVKEEKEAKEIITTLNKVEAGKLKEEFAKLATAKSTDEGSKVNGGQLGFFGAGQMVEPFEKAAFAAEIGKMIAEPVKSEFGYHVILVTGAREKFEDYQADIKKTLETKVISEFFAKLEKDAKIDVKIKFETAAPSGMPGGTPPTGGDSSEGMPPATGENPHGGANPEVPLDEGQAPEGQK